MIQMTDEGVNTVVDNRPTNTHPTSCILITLAPASSPSIINQEHRRKHLCGDNVKKIQGEKRLRETQTSV